MARLERKRSGTSQWLVRGAPVALVVLVCAVLASVARGSGAEAEVDPTVRDLLSGINFVPGTIDIDLVAGDSADLILAAIAANDSGSEDPGVRIRALRALGLYPGSAAGRAALEAVIADHGGATSGTDVLLLRAAMGALARTLGTEAVEALVPLLDHPARDIRVAAAQALAETGSDQAIQPLRNRYAIESVLQVKLAISRALQVLEGLGP